jgi:hypothetical protein
VEVAFLFCVGEGVRLGVRDTVPVGRGEAVAVEVRVAVSVRLGVRLGVNVEVEVTVAVLVGVGLAVNVAVEVCVGVGVKVNSSVKVAVGASVGVGEGTRVAVGRAVCVGDTVGPGVGGKSWFATGSPTSAEATLTENKKSASRSHFQPASIWARRIRKNETLRADWIERMPAQAASNAPDTNSATIRMMPTSVLINFEIILPLITGGAHSVETNLTDIRSK